MQHQRMVAPGKLASSYYRSKGCRQPDAKSERGDPATGGCDHDRNKKSINEMSAIPTNIH